MTGQMVSNVSTRAAFHRAGADTGPSIHFLMPDERDAANDELKRDGFAYFAADKNGVIVGLKKTGSADQYVRFRSRLIGNGLWSGEPFRLLETEWDVECGTGDLWRRSVSASDSSGKIVSAETFSDVAAIGASGEGREPTAENLDYTMAAAACRPEGQDRALAPFEVDATKADLSRQGYKVMPIGGKGNMVAGTREIARAGSWKRIELIEAGSAASDYRNQYGRFVLDIDCFGRQAILIEQETLKADYSSLDRDSFFDVFLRDKPLGQQGGKTLDTSNGAYGHIFKAVCEA